MNYQKQEGKKKRVRWTSIKCLIILVLDLFIIVVYNEFWRLDLYYHASQIRYL